MNIEKTDADLLRNLAAQLETINRSKSLTAPDNTPEDLRRIADLLENEFAAVLNELPDPPRPKIPQSYW